MDVLPAIDLREGKVVRLRRGDYAAQTTYSDNPPEIAAQLVALGARWIHIVDLDAARTGHLSNTEAIRAIRDTVDVQIQVGGGARSEEVVRRMLDDTGRHFVIENVIGAPLRTVIELCGNSFGLHVYRHRRFECSFMAWRKPHKHHTVRCQRQGYQ